MIDPNAAKRGATTDRAGASRAATTLRGRESVRGLGERPRAVQARHGAQTAGRRAAHARMLRTARDLARTPGRRLPHPLDRSA